MKIKRLNEHHAAGVGTWLNGDYIFPQERRAQAMAGKPTIDPIGVRADIKDSGQSGFLRYPMIWGPNSHPSYPALSKDGAGL